MPKPIKGLLILILVAGGVGLCLFVKMYRDDLKALKNFLAAYNHFDMNIAGAVARARIGEVDDAREALDELKARADLRLSSLIKNDGELMRQAREIAALAIREYESRLAGREEESSGLGEQRRTAFKHFIDLSDADLRGPEAGESP